MPSPPEMRIDCGDALLTFSDGYLTVDWGRSGGLSLPAAWCGDAQVVFAAGELQFSCRFTAPTRVSGSPDLVTFRLSVPTEHGTTAFQIAQRLREAGAAASDPPDRWEASSPLVPEGVPPADAPSLAGHAPGSSRAPSPVPEPQRHADGRWAPEESGPAAPAGAPVHAPAATASEGPAYGAPGSFGETPGGSAVSPGTPVDAYGFPPEAATDRLGAAGPAVPSGEDRERDGTRSPHDPFSTGASAPELRQGMGTSPPSDQPWGPPGPGRPVQQVQSVQPIRPVESVESAPTRPARTPERRGTHPVFDPGRADRSVPLNGTPGQVAFTGRTASEAPPLFPASSAGEPSGDPPGVRTVTTAPEKDQWVSFRPGPDTEQLIARLPQQEGPNAADRPGEEGKSHG